MKSELKTGRPFWAFIGTIVLLLSSYLDATHRNGWSNITLFIGCFIFGAVFQSIRQQKRQAEEDSH
jgi:ABC-type Fe3+-siderophore transport system permease subunit